MLRIGLECIITKALFVMTVSIQIDTRVLSLDAVASVKKCRSRIFHKSKPACASRFEDDQTFSTGSAGGDGGHTGRWRAALHGRCRNWPRAEMLKRLNTVLLRTPNRGFITCLCMILTSSGHVTLANAGHLSPYLDGVEMATEPSLPVGFVPDMNYEQTSYFLPAMARLTLMSDGVVEARSETGELYGFERTSKISLLTAKDIAAEANRFGQEDDITVITLDWRLQGIAIARRRVRTGEYST